MIIRNMTAVVIATTIETNRYLLKPGVNDVPPEIWAKWRETPVMKSRLEAEKVIEPKAEEVEEQAPELPTLEKLSIAKACELVKQTFDVELLEKWIVDEKRERVLKALEKQLEAVEVKAKKEGAGDDNADPEGDDDEEQGEKKPGEKKPGAPAE